MATDDDDYYCRVAERNKQLLRGSPRGIPHTTATDDEEGLCPNVSHVDHNDEKEHVSERHRVSHVFVVLIFFHLSVTRMRGVSVTFHLQLSKCALSTTTDASYMNNKVDEES